MTQNDVYHKLNDVTNVPFYSRLKQGYINVFLQASFGLLLKLAFKIWCHFVQNLQRYDNISKMYQNVHCNLIKKNFSIQEWPLYKGLLLEKYSECFIMFGAILKATNSSFRKGMAFCLSVYVKKVMTLLAFIFEQPSYLNIYDTYMAKIYTQYGKIN